MEEQQRYITGANTDEIWQQINADFGSLETLNDYHVLIKHDKYEIILDIDIHLGGDEEGGYETTIFTSELPSQQGYRFAIHPEDFLQHIGKWFGIEDKVIGYPEFDKNLIVKTNDIAKTNAVFADADAREVFQNESGFSLSIVEDEDLKVEILELTVLRGVTNAAELKTIYNAYVAVLSTLV